jgi:hypothetical protein
MIQFGEAICCNPDVALTREWLETNGLGSTGRCARSSPFVTITVRRMKMAP